MRASLGSSVEIWPELVGAARMHQLSHLHALGERGGMSFLSRLLKNLARNAIELVDRLDHVHRHANRARLVGERTRHGLAHPPRRVGGKLPAASILEFVDGLHQANIAFLN